MTAAARGVRDVARSIVGDLVAESMDGMRDLVDAEMQRHFAARAAELRTSGIPIGRDPELAIRAIATASGRSVDEVRAEMRAVIAALASVPPIDDAALERELLPVTERRNPPGSESSDDGARR